MKRNGGFCQGTRLRAVCGAPLLAVLVAGLPLAGARALTGPNGILAPTGINPSTGQEWKPGDTYHLVFVTAATTQAVSSVIADYDAFVNAEAQRAGSLVQGYPVTWSVIGSTASPLVNARDHALVSAPVYRLDGTLVATGYADMWDASLQAAILKNQFGASFSTTVWTGTGPNGLVSTKALGTSSVRYGNSSLYANQAWIDAWNMTGPTAYKPVYALSELLTIEGSVTEPPGEPNTPSPTNTETYVSLSATLSWLSADATGFVVSLWREGGAMTNTAVLGALSWQPGGLSYSMTYQWQVVATNAVGSTAGPVWTFTTRYAPVPPSGLLAPTGTNPETGKPWSPGDTYHLVFLTEGTTQATSSDIAAYDAFVNEEAQRWGSLVTGYTVNWYVIGSTLSANANAHALVSAPVYRLDGTLVAAGYADLWDGSIAAPIRVDQFGDTHSTSVWTGSTTAGVAYATRALGLGDVRFGYAQNVNGSWIDAQDLAASSLYKPLYALSEPLKIPGPLGTVLMVH